MAFKGLKKLLDRISSLFKKKGELKIGLYGPVNSGKTTLANKICKDWLGEDMGKASIVPHETREIQTKENVKIERDGKSLTFNLVDTPGIATRIDFEDFVKFGMGKKKAKSRAKEATKGVIESIKWLDNMDMVLVVVDSTRDPLTQVNLTILGNLDARGVPFLIVANKADLKQSQLKRVEEAFQNYRTVGISARTGHRLENLYDAVLETV
ncbi:MAG: GTP-binding protein [Candidatus Aenigmarchaeota archaeon]|nr:GTP-binding protein [Candidatus Aenigmarchaeota archaeon]